MKQRVLLLILTLLLVSGILSCAAGDDDDDDDQVGDDDTAPDDDDDQPEPPGEYFPPDQRGPYPVGVTTTFLVDESRFELWGKRDRLLPLDIWYPATEGGGWRNKISDEIGPIPPWAYPLFIEYYQEELFEKLLDTETTAMREAPLLVSEKPRPVILFSHGLTAIRFQNYSLCEHLASHGFIVVAPDHYGNAIFINDQKGQIILTNPVAMLTSYTDRVIDIDFIYRWLSDQQFTPGGWLEKQLNLGRFGVTGHSYGGLTALLAGGSLHYVHSIAPLNPAWIGNFPEDFSKPFLMLQGDLDNIVGQMNPPTFNLWMASPSEKKLHLNMVRGGHYSATDACLLLPEGLIPDSTTGCGGDEQISNQRALELLNSYLTAFFKVTLADDDRYLDYLLVNHDETELETIHNWTR